MSGLLLVAVAPGTLLYVSGALAVVALVAAVVMSAKLKNWSPGNDDMRRLSGAIRQGAMAFLKTEYMILSVFVVILAAVLIVISQLPAFTGIDVEATGNPLRTAWDVGHQLQSAAPAALLIGAAGLAVLWATRRYGAFLVPGAGRDHPISRTGPGRAGRSTCIPRAAT